MQPQSEARKSGERTALVPTPTNPTLPTSLPTPTNPTLPTPTHPTLPTLAGTTDNTKTNANSNMALPTRMTASPSGASSGSLTHALSSLATTTPDAASVLFFRHSTPQKALFLAVSAASFGVLPLVCVWVPQLHTRLTKQQVATVDEADVVLVKRFVDNAAQSSDIQSGGGTSSDDGVSSAPTSGRVSWEECPLQRLQGVAWFEFRKSRHFYDAKKQGFVRLQNELQDKYGELDKRLKSGGLSGSTASEWLEIYGPNAIDLKPMPWQSVLFRKVVHPFYLFQVASALIWFSEQYTTYALIILTLSALSIAWEVYSQVVNDQKLHDLVHVDASVKVLRDQHVQSVGVRSLVVGDVVVVEEGLVPADLLLLTGECTADESTLTGEAIPITKQHLLNASSETRIDTTIKTKTKESVLHAGSTILAVKADNSTRGVVLATGFSTSKGELFRSIVFPKPINYKIEQDSYRFMAALSLIAVLAFIKRMVQASKFGVSPGDALTSSLDLVTIAVPPALPLILTVGVGFALTRLEVANIFCINSQRINLAGHVDTFCFDKTGTLSSDHLDFQGVDECSSTSATFVGMQSEVDVLSINAIVGLATCHGLNERSGHVTGYALELDMFRATGYSIETNIHKRNTPNAPFSVLISSPIGKTFGIVKRYLFDASLQRSSALIEDFESGQRVVYTKGSPEAIMAICNQATIPANYMEKTRAYAYQGYYVVALASKTYPVTADVPQREAMECRLNFLGFILFLNKIKTESPYVISTLEEANVDVRIITGDNAFTAIHVSRKINMELQSTVMLLDVDKTNNNRLVFADVDDLASQSKPQWMVMEPKTFLSFGDNNEFALTGAALEQLQTTQNSLFVEQVVLKTKIFSRIRPHQKTWIIETLIQRGRTVGMVGDGTNDCGALKAAHIGIALSDADASIVAPFTSRKKQISDVVELLREGRCALSTSFVAFKFMVLYSIVQLTMSSLMNDYASQMSNNQFLFDDLVVVFGLSMLMVRTAAAERLTKEMPAKSLFAPTILFSLAGQVMFLFICLGIAISAAKAKDWYCSAEHALELTRAGNMSAIEPPCYVFVSGQSPDLTQHSYENSVIWLFGHLQYWIVAVAFNIKDTYRKPFYTNKPFAFYLVLLFFILHIQLFSYKSEQATQTVGVDTSFGVLKLPAGFEASLFFLFLFDLLLALVWELLVVGIVLNRWEQRQQSGSWGFSTGRRMKSSSYVADRDSLLSGSGDYGVMSKSKKRDSTGTVTPSKAGNAVSVDVDDDEEEDVLNLKRQEIV